MNIERRKEFINHQLSIWKEAKINYYALESIETRDIIVNNFQWHIQFNPARIRSTAALTDKQSIRERKCFLCRENRPTEQMIFPLTDEFDLLVNPYPIFPIHFTITHRNHIPQSSPPSNAAEIAKLLKGCVVFFNGAKSGASAPDHFHLQAVEKSRLPLIKKFEDNSAFLLESNKSELIRTERIPFNYFTGISKIESDISHLLFKIDQLLYNLNLKWDSTNCFFWIDSQDNFRFLVIPRKAHRPSCYFKEGDERLLISPGSIDLAGVIITPRREDFEKLNSKSLKKILEEVTFCDLLPCAKQPLI